MEMWNLLASLLIITKSINHVTIFVLTVSPNLSLFEKLMKRNPAPSHTHFISPALFSPFHFEMCISSEYSEEHYLVDGSITSRSEEGSSDSYADPCRIKEIFFF